jgi:quinol monooxygenase YgiN
MKPYLLHGKLTAQQNHRNELANILLEASQLISVAKGCKLYVVGLDESDPNSVFVTEIWDSQQDHDNSLQVVGVKDLIMKAMPILDGQPQKGQQINLLGGFGL